MNTRRVLAISLLTCVLALTLLRYGSVVARGGGDFQTSDWLINYSGGFVRRGLFGEVFLIFAPLGQLGLWVLFAVQVALYVPVVMFLTAYMARCAYSWWSVALVCGPAALLFLGLQPGGAFRKEILGLVALVLLAKSHDAVRAWLWQGAAVAVWLLAVFSWEGNAFLLFPALYLARTRSRDGRRNLILSALLGAIALAGVVSALYYHGSIETRDAVCAEIRSHAFEATALCGGSVEALAMSGVDGLAKVGSAFPTYFVYLPVLLLAVLPSLGTVWIRRHWRWAVAIFVGMVPLFVIAVDYGRWIFMITISLSICIAAARLDPGDGWQWNGWATVAYLVTWAPPYYVAPGTAWPATGLIVVLARTFGVAPPGW